MSSTNTDVPDTASRDVGPHVGQQVGEYVIESKIGEGGFGTVFRAVHPVIGKVVAIKVLHRRYSAQPEMVSRFVAEARVVNQIRHRHIIDIFDFRQLEDGRHYYVMEHLEGCSLEDYIVRHGVLELAEAIPILRGLARALDAAHAKGIAHRDLKPDNVFLVMDEESGIEPKLLDFGIAKLLSEEMPQGHKTRTGAPIGTPQYMSPEQCRGRGVDHRTDIYSFGIMAYRMLTGALPFDGDEYMDILLAQISDPPVPPSRILGSLPDAIDQAIEGMLKKDPNERPPNLRAAVRSLEEAALKAGIALPQPTPSVSRMHPVHTGSHAAQGTPSGSVSLGTGVSGEGGRLSGSRSDARSGSMSGNAIGIVSPGIPTAGQMNLRGGGRARFAIIAAGLLGAVVMGFVVHRVLAPESPEVSTAAAMEAGGNDSAGQPSQTPEAAENAGPGPASGAVAVAGGSQKSNQEQTSAPAAKPFVNLVIKGPPRGTEVYAHGKLLGVVPKVQLPRGDEPIILTFKAAAHRPATYEVTPAQDATIKVRLDRRRRGPAAGKRARPPARKKPVGRDTIEDPFKN